MRRFKMAFILLALFATGFFAAKVSAVPLGFNCISNNLAGDCAIGETQLSAEVDDFGTSVVFTFFNTGSDDIFIDGAYFYDGIYLDALDVTLGGSAGVNFSDPATPGNLPAYDSDPLAVFYSSDADPAAPVNGVNPGEFLTVEFGLLDGVIFDDVLAALDSGALTVGLKAQGFLSGGSETFLGYCEYGCGEPEDPPNGVPEPSGLALIATGLFGLTGITAYRRKYDKEL